LYVPFGSEKNMVEVTDDFSTLFTVTDQLVPDGSPDSVYFTAYPYGDQAIVTLADAPETGTEPDAGVALYPLRVPTVYEKVPFFSWNVMVDVADDNSDPLSVTDQVLPVGRPVSVNVTL